MHIRLRKLLIFLFLLSFFPFSIFSLTIEDDFESLLGKDLKGWQHVQKEKDFLEIALYKKLYEKNKHLQFLFSPNRKIPKILHFIWIGPNNFPLSSIKNVRSWLAHNKGWKIKFWTDRPRPSPCKEMEICLVENFSFHFLKNYYKKAKNWGEKSDLLRYEILLQEGGIYVDHDANCLRSFDLLSRSYDLFACAGTPHERVGDIVTTVCNHLIGASPNHPVIRECIDILAKKELMPSQKDVGSMVISTTYLAFTLAIHKKISQRGFSNIIFPASYFLGREGLPNFYSTHFYEGRWIDKKKEDKKYLKKLSKVKTQTIFLFLLQFIFFFSLLFYKKKIITL